MTPNAQEVSRDFFTVLTPNPKKPLTKVITVKDGKPSVDGRNNMSAKFDYKEVYFTDFDSMAAAFEKISKIQHNAVIRGELAEGLTPSNQLRRKNTIRQDGSGTINEVNHQWVMLDFDNITLDCQPPEEDPEDAIKELMRKLPPAFRHASCWWQYSSSQGFKGDKLNIHLAFWLDMKVSNTDLKRLLDVENEVYIYETGASLIDSCLCDSIQIHYTAAPVLIDIADPLPRRSGVHKGDDDTAYLKDSWVLETKGTDNGYYRFLDRIGDDKDGFHQPILSAIASWINYHGEPRGDALRSLTAIIRDRIDAAYVMPDRDPGTLNRYRSEEFIRGAAQRAVAKGFKQTINQKIDVGGLVNQYVYVNHSGEFYDPSKDLSFGEKQINNMYMRLGNSAARAMLKSDELKRVDHIQCIPGDDTFTHLLGRQVYNSWAGRPVEPASDEEDVSTFTDHIKFLVDDDEDAYQHLSRFLAHIISKPGVRIRHCIILGSSVQGVGKSYLRFMLEHTMGGQNIRSVNTTTLKEKFNGWAQDAELVVIEELMARGRMEMANHLKPMITEDKISIRKMNTDAYDTKIFCNFLAFTNHENAMMLEQSERRYWVWFTKRDCQPASYYNHLFKWTEQNAPALYRWALNYDLSAFDPSARPPRTKSTETMIALSANPAEEYFKSRMDEEMWPFQHDLILLNDLQDVLPTGLAKMSTAKLGSIIKDFGGVNMGKKRFPDGTYPRVWSIRNHLKYRDMSGTNLAKEYRKPGRHDDIETTAF